MRRYHQLTSEERYALSTLKKQGFSEEQIARALGRQPLDDWQELQRNARNDGWYRPSSGDDLARWRRSRSRRNRQFDEGAWRIVERHLRQDWSPEQVAGRLALEGILSISHETIYRYVWTDRQRGGGL